MDDPVNVELLMQPFPDHAILTRAGAGGRSFRYVAAHTVIRRLNDATGCRWDFRLTRMELHGDIWIAAGELTIPGLGTRAGIGVQKVSAGGGEDLVKGAASDALKKAAVSFGVGLDLYGPDLEAGDVAPPPQRPQNAPNGSQRGNGPPPTQRPPTGPQNADDGPITRQGLASLGILQKELGMEDDHVHDLVETVVPGKRSRKDLTVAEGRAVWRAMNGLRRTAAPPPTRPVEVRDLGEEAAFANAIGEPVPARLAGMADVAERRDPDSWRA